MAKKPKGGQEEHPDGPLIDLSTEERKRLKGEREKLGLTQAQLGKKAGLTAGTISNVESGRSKQVRKVVYAKILRALKLKATNAPEVEVVSAEVFGSLVEDLAVLSPENTDVVVRLVASLRKSQQSG